MTGSGSPASDDWGGVFVTGSSGSIDLEHTTVKYAGDAIAFGGTNGLLVDVTVANASEAVQVSAKSVTLRGNLENDHEGVRACSWESLACSMDAAYTYWGSAEGPFPSDAKPLACGAVTTSPYLTSESGGSSTDGSVFGATNCDGAPTPEEQFDSAQQEYSDELAGEQISCGEGFEEACKEIEATEKCLGAATSLAQESSPFDFSNEATDVAADGGEFLENLESDTVSTFGDVAHFGGEIVGAVGTILDAAKAYSQCG